MSDKEIIFTVPMSGTCQFNNNTMKLLHNEPYVLIAKSERDALKSDYDALKKENEELSTSESEYQKVCEFIAKNFGDLSCCYDAEDVIGLAQSAVDRLKSKLEKAELEVKFVKEYLNPADTSFKQMIDAFRVLPKEKQDKLINLSQSLVDLENT